jgi:hypothetical protein
MAPMRRWCALIANPRPVSLNFPSNAEVNARVQVVVNSRYTKHTMSVKNAEMAGHGAGPARGKGVYAWNS